MDRWIVLLRGINVGGHNRVPMAELRDLLTGLGFVDVVSYIQSGNIALDATREPDPASLSTVISDAFEVEVPVVVVSRSSLVEILEQMPFNSTEIDPKLIHTVFFDHAPEPDSITSIDPERYLPDRFTIVGRAAHVVYPNGSARSKLTIDVFERALDVTATARNLKTVRWLAEL